MKKIVVAALMLFSFAFSPAVIAQQVTKKPATATTKKLTEEQKINHLIKYVHGLDGATFIRNGSDYPAKAAADHLQMKREKAGSRVKTARQFIDVLASESSMSGKAYQIKFKDGKTYSSRQVLMKELERIEKL